MLSYAREEPGSLFKCFYKLKGRVLADPRQGMCTMRACSTSAVQAGQEIEGFFHRAESVGKASRQGLSLACALFQPLGVAKGVAGLTDDGLIIEEDSCEQCLDSCPICCIACCVCCLLAFSRLTASVEMLETPAHMEAHSVGRQAENHPSVWHRLSQTDSPPLKSTQTCNFSTCVSGGSCAQTPCMDRCPFVAAGLAFPQFWVDVVICHWLPQTIFCPPTVSCR